VPYVPAPEGIVVPPPEPETAPAQSHRQGRPNGHAPNGHAPHGHRPPKRHRGRGGRPQGNGGPSHGGGHRPAAAHADFVRKLGG
jgi:hypothetical protein